MYLIDVWVVSIFREPGSYQERNKCNVWADWNETSCEVWTGRGPVGSAAHVQIAWMDEWPEQEQRHFFMFMAVTAQRGMPISESAKTIKFCCLKTRQKNQWFWLCVHSPLDVAFVLVISSHVVAWATKLAWPTVIRSCCISKSPDWVVSRSECKCTLYKCEVQAKRGRWLVKLEVQSQSRRPQPGPDQTAPSPPRNSCFFAGGLQDGGAELWTSWSPSDFAAVQSLLFDAIFSYFHRFCSCRTINPTKKTAGGKKFKF